MKRFSLKVAVTLTLLAATGMGLAPSTAQAKTPGVSVEDAKALLDIGITLHKLITDVNRSGRIYIHNHTGYTLDNPRNYLFSGNIVGLNNATEIPPGYANAVAVKKSNGAATGCVGVITYRIKGTRSRLAILYSIPHSYGLYENWFKFSVISDRTPVNKKLYCDMYYNYGKLTKGRVAKASSGQSAWKRGEFTTKGTMDTSGDFTMHCKIYSTRNPARKPAPKPGPRPKPQLKKRYYRIVSASANAALDVPGSSRANGTKIGLYTQHKGQNQQWSMEKVGTHYRFVSRVSGKSLQIALRGNLVHQSTTSNSYQQRYRVEAVRAGMFKITSVKSGNALTAGPNNSLVQSRYTGGKNQLWKFVLAR